MIVSERKCIMTIGYALTGSFCTIKKSLSTLESLCSKYDVIPICSNAVATTDTRFIKAEDTIKTLEDLTGNKVISKIEQAEPIGPKKLIDVMVVAPCTGNTIGKIALGLTDTAVSMAVKSHLRNDRPVVLAISTNDGLSGSAKNIGSLLARKNIYFVPYGQDDCIGKATSLVAHFDMIDDTISYAAKGQQIQPILKAY